MKKDSDDYKRSNQGDFVLKLSILLLVLSQQIFGYAAQIEVVDGVYKGTLGKEEVVLEMGTTGGLQRPTVMVGRYFYRRHGSATQLSGTWLQDGRIYLKKDEPYSLGDNEFWLTLRGEKALGEFSETEERPGGPAVTRSAVSLTRISKGFDPNMPVTPANAQPDQAYYDFLLDFPIKRSREIRIDREVAYIVQSDPRFPSSLPRLTRFPNPRVKAKVNADITEEFSRRRLLDSECAESIRFEPVWQEKNSVTFISRDILSLLRVTRDYCHSDESQVDALLYNLHTGERLEINDLFRMQGTTDEPEGRGFLPNAASFLPFVDLYRRHIIKFEDDCKVRISRDAYLQGAFSLTFYFLNEGFVLSPLVDRDARHCADEEIIPYSELRGLLRSDTPFRSILKLAHSKVLGSPLAYVARSLQAVHEGEFSGQDVIPPRVRYLQSRFKHELQRFIGEVINQSAENSTLQQMRCTMLKKLRSMGIFEGFKEYGPDYTYGHVLDVKLERILQHPDLLAIGLIIDVNWDEDESLYIFQHQSNGWVNVLAAEVNGYPEVEDAQSSRFNYAVSPSTPDGTWFVVTSSVNPHKASAWQHVTYTALAPGPDAGHPRLLMRHTHVIYLAGSDDESHACHIKTTANGFRVSFNMGWDIGGEDKRFIDEYRVANGVIRRIAGRCRTRNIMGRRVSCDPEDKM